MLADVGTLLQSKAGLRVLDYLVLARDGRYLQKQQVALLQRVYLTTAHFTMPIICLHRALFESC